MDLTIMLNNRGQLRHWPIPKLFKPTKMAAGCYTSLLLFFLPKFKVCDQINLSVLI